MAQAGSSFGRSILTPKPRRKSRIVQIPCGNYWPVQRGQSQTPNLSSTLAARQYVAPTANMTYPRANAIPNAAATPPYTGKGKAPAEARKAPSQESNGARSLASPPSERADSPLLDNDLDPTIAAVMRYQAEVDELERERDREDSTYPEPTPDPEDRSEAERVNGIRNTPRTRSRAPVNENGFDARPIQQPEFHIPSSPAAQQPARKKRQAADANTTKTTPAKRGRPSTNNVHHRNQTFASLMEVSKVKRIEALKRIKSSWGVSEERLMDLPFAPRRTTDPGHPIIKPLDWNSLLLGALVELAALTRCDFERACHAAKEAFETESLLDGSTQLTYNIVTVAIGKIQSASFSREDPGSIQRPSANAASPGRPVAQPDQQRPHLNGNATASATTRPFGGSSAQTVTSNPVPLPAQQDSAKNGRTKGNPPTVLAGECTVPAASRTTTRTPLSPVASPTSIPAHPVKIEQAVSGAQSDYCASDDESSHSEHRLDLESRQRIAEHELAIVNENIAMDNRKRREKEKKAARLRQHGGFVGDALLV